MALPCQPTPASLPERAGRRGHSLVRDHITRPSPIPQYSLGLKTLKRKPFASFPSSNCLVNNNVSSYSFFGLLVTQKPPSIASCQKQTIHHNGARWKLKWKFKQRVCFGSYSIRPFLKKQNKLLKSVVACVNSFPSAETEAPLSTCLQSTSLEIPCFDITALCSLPASQRNTSAIVCFTLLILSMPPATTMLESPVSMD